jgi:hypothetical protein
MWGTTSSCAEPIGNFRAAFEAISIDDLPLVSSFRGKLAAQHFRSFAAQSVSKGHRAILSGVPSTLIAFAPLARDVRRYFSILSFAEGGQSRVRTH